LISWGYDNEDNIRKRYIHTIIDRYKWFHKNEQEERKNNNFTCPFAGNQKKKKQKKLK